MGRWNEWGWGWGGFQINEDDNFNFSNLCWSLSELDLSLEAGLEPYREARQRERPPYSPSTVYRGSQVIPIRSYCHRCEAGSGAGSSFLSHTLHPSPAQSLATMKT